MTLNEKITEEFTKSFEKILGKNLQLVRSWIAGALIRKDYELNFSPYRLVRDGGPFPWYSYLHIKGCVGHGKSGGGRYRFVAFYCEPDIYNKRGQLAPECFCEQNGIKYGHGDTIMEALQNLDSESTFESSLATMRKAGDDEEANSGSL